jgi:hypothetical protein
VFTTHGTVFTLERALVPLAKVTPRTKTLVGRFIARKVAVLNHSFLEMATLSKVDLLVIAHLDCRGYTHGSSNLDWLEYSDC